MQLAMIGLGRMGANMTRRLLQGGHAVVGYDVNTALQQTMAAEGVHIAATLPEVTTALAAPRVIWLMVPSGAPVEQTLAALRPHLAPGDILIDGGNSNYKDTIRRATDLEQDGVFFLDAGTSGGLWGLMEGYCLMVGGAQVAFQQIEPILHSLAPEDGYAHVGPSGTGHFVKMIHNGIEYGLMQAYAEGFELMRAKTEFNLDLHQIATLWQHGSVVRSWLLDLAAQALEREPDLASIQGWVADSGEGRWTVMESIDLEVPAPVIVQSLYARFASRQPESFSAKMLAALRNEFGGHAVQRPTTSRDDDLDA